MSRFLRRLEKSIRRRVQAPGKYQAWREVSALERWRQAGEPVPPPHLVKVHTLRTYARRFGTPTLVETGTFQGAMIEAVRSEFETVHSIELAEPLFAAAVEKFKGDEAVHIHQGDSGEVLGPVLEGVDTACLFWLDGHYSGGPTAHGDVSTPILKELDVIKGHGVPNHVILIDDARCFNGEDDYPTIADLRERALALWPDAEFEVAGDIIRIHS